MLSATAPRLVLSLLVAVLMLALTCQAEDVSKLTLYYDIEMGAKSGDIDCDMKTPKANQKVQAMGGGLLQECQVKGGVLWCDIKNLDNCNQIKALCEGIFEGRLSGYRDDQCGFSKK